MVANVTTSFESTELLPPSDGEFRRYQALVDELAGIHLNESKRALLVGRLAKRLRQLHLKGYGEYLRIVADPANQAERIVFIDSICTNETSFFREPHHFETLEREILPTFRAAAEAGQRPRALRAWSAGCSSGEEPYTLAMVLLDYFPPSSGWSIEILATDLSTKILARAAAGLYAIERAAQIPQRYLKAYMLRGVGEQEGLMKVGPEIAGVVRFAQLNLAESSYAAPKGLDIVFCRNVLIYFDRTRKERIVRQLFSHLQPAGYLFVGHAESLAGMIDRPRPVAPTVYAGPAAPAPPRRTR